MAILPDHVATALPPRLVLWPRRAHRITILESTFRRKTRLEESHLGKLTKYEELVEEIGIKGWSYALGTIQVGL